LITHTRTCVHTTAAFEGTQQTFPRRCWFYSKRFISFNNVIFSLLFF
jgi:hypothetical protein